MNRLVFLPFLAAAILAAPQFDGVTPPADLPGGITPPNGTQPQPPADFPQPTPPSANSTTLPPPPADLPGAGAITPPTSAPPPGGEGGDNSTSTESSADQGGNNPQLPIPGSPIAPAGGSARAMRALPVHLPVAQYVYPYQQPVVVQGYQAPIVPVASGYQYQYQHVPVYYPLK